jgi:hypothetical protein
VQVTLAQSCRTGSQGLQERAAGALWGLSVSEVNSIAIGRGGGVAPLIALARSEFEVSFLFADMSSDLKYP